MHNLSKSQIFDLFIEKLSDYNHTFFREHHEDMIKKRISKADTIDNIVSSCKGFIDLPTNLDIIELGCSFGFLSFINIMYGKKHIRSWTGYDIDQTSITVANDIKNYLNADCTEFIYSAISSSEHNHTYVYGSDDLLLSMSIEQPLVYNSSYRKIPNLNYKRLPKCDILLIDIEGEEKNIDIDLLNFKVCLLETNDNTATDIYLDKINSKTNFKIIKHDISINPDQIRKGDFLIIKN